MHEIPPRPRLSPVDAKDYIVVNSHDRGRPASEWGIRSCLPPLPASRRRSSGFTEMALKTLNSEARHEVHPVSSHSCRHRCIARRWNGGGGRGSSSGRAATRPFDDRRHRRPTECDFAEVPDLGSDPRVGRCGHRQPSGDSNESLVGRRDRTGEDQPVLQLSGHLVGVDVDSSGEPLDGGHRWCWLPVAGHGSSCLHGRRWGDLGLHSGFRILNSFHVACGVESRPGGEWD